MPETYTTKQLYSFFGVSHQTIKNWCRDFEDWLSPTARPEKNRMRVFTEDDVRVFALVHRLKGEGKFNADIKASLGAGQRDQLPVVPMELAPPQNTALAIALQQVQDLQDMVMIAKKRETELELQVEILEKMLYKAQKRVVQLELQLKFEDED